MSYVKYVRCDVCGVAGQPDARWRELRRYVSRVKHACPRCVADARRETDDLTEYELTLRARAGERRSGGV